ncbi:hypothetical protein TNCV_990331 [Trichonephila clavipes]|nr:hypothetical protein TNCV_990331 [Trichonephila clavipes]
MPLHRLQRFIDEVTRDLPFVYAFVGGLLVFSDFYRRFGIPLRKLRDTLERTPIATVPEVRRKPEGSILVPR